MADPTHILYVQKKDKKTVRRRIGAGWQDKNGWISIRLDTCVFLTDRDDVYINLYPVKSGEEDSSDK